MLNKSSPVQSVLSESKYIRIKIKKKNLTFAEEFYRNVPIDHYPQIQYQGRFGTKTEKCGSFKHLFMCDCGHTKKILLHSCNNINCPNCHITANRRMAKQIATRLDAIYRLWIRSGWAKPHFNHIVISPPNDERLPDSWKFKNFKEYQKKKRQILRDLKRWKASGVLIFHPYRKTVIKKRVSWKTDPKRMKTIKTIKLVYSPHFHLLGNMWIPPDFFQRYGYICTKLRNDDNDKIVKLYRFRHYYNRANYLLTHSGYYKDKKTYVWIGSYSYNQIHMYDRKVHYSHVICEKCERLVWHYEGEVIINDVGKLIIERDYQISLNRDYPLRDKKIYYELFYG
jgi:hypothetical protein